MYKQRDDDGTSRGYCSSRRWALVPVLIAAGLIAVFVGLWLYSGALAAASASATYPWYWWFPFGWWWFIFIPVFFLIFFAVRWYFWGGRWWGGGRGWCYGAYDTALEALRQRYAKGEITKEQYDQMRSTLEG